MNKQMSNTFYDQMKVYLIIKNNIKWYKHFIYLEKHFW